MCFAFLRSGHTELRKYRHQTSICNHTPSSIHRHTCTHTHNTTQLMVRGPRVQRRRRPFVFCWCSRSKRYTHRHTRTHTCTHAETRTYTQRTSRTLSRVVSHSRTPFDVSELGRCVVCVFRACMFLCVTPTLCAGMEFWTGSGWSNNIGALNCFFNPIVKVRVVCCVLL